MPYIHIDTNDGNIKHQCSSKDGQVAENKWCYTSWGLVVWSGWLVGPPTEYSSTYCTPYNMHIKLFEVSSMLWRQPFRQGAQPHTVGREKHCRWEVIWYHYLVLWACLVYNQAGVKGPAPSTLLLNQSKIWGDTNQIVTLLFSTNSPSRVVLDYV